MPVLHTGCYHCGASNDFGVWYEPRGRPADGLRLQQWPSAGAEPREAEPRGRTECISPVSLRSTGSRAQLRIGSLDGTTGSEPGARTRVGDRWTSGVTPGRQSQGGGPNVSHR